MKIIIHTFYIVTLAFLLDSIKCQSKTPSQTQTASSSSSSSSSGSSSSKEKSSNDQETSFHTIINQHVVKNGELLACGGSNCQIIREFAFQEKHNYNCYQHSLSINFFTMSMLNGSKSLEQGHILYIKKYYNLEEAPIQAFNLIHKNEKKHPSCLRIKRLLINTIFN